MHDGTVYVWVHRILSERRVTISAKVIADRAFLFFE